MSLEDFEKLLGAAAVTFVRYVIAGSRWLHGEGHWDKRIDPLMAKMLGVLLPHLLTEMKWGEKLIVAAVIDDLVDVYRKYLDGSIGTRDALRDVLKSWASGLVRPLTAREMEVLVPERATISDMGGPVTYAKHAIGKLEGIHWKTVHNWTTSLRDYLATDQESALLRPYGLAVTAQDVCDFVAKHADFNDENSAAVMQRLIALREALNSAIAAAEEVPAPMEEGMVPPGDPPSGGVDPAVPSRNRAGPGRPRKIKG